MSDVFGQSCRLVSAASSTLGAFVIGAIGSVAGTIVAWLLIGQRLGPDGWKVSALFFLYTLYLGTCLSYVHVIVASLLEYCLILHAQPCTQAVLVPDG